MPVKRVNSNLTKKDFKLANDWTEDILSATKSVTHSSPVFTITNRENEIIESVKFKQSVEDMIHDYADVLQPGFIAMMKRMLKDSETND